MITSSISFDTWKFFLSLFYHTVLNFLKKTNSQANRRTDVFRSYEIVYKTFILIASLLTFEHPFWGLSTLGNLAAFKAQSTQLMCSENLWSVQINTEKCSLSFKSSINISDPPGTLFWNHLSPCHKGNVSRWQCGDYTRESCKRFLACRSFLIEPLCEWNLRVISDLQKHKRQIFMSFVTKKELWHNTLA